MKLGLLCLEKSDNMFTEKKNCGMFKRAVYPLAVEGIYLIIQYEVVRDFTDHIIMNSTG